MSYSYLQLLLWHGLQLNQHEYICWKYIGEDNNTNKNMQEKKKKIKYKHEFNQPDSLFASLAV